MEQSNKKIFIGCIPGSTKEEELLSVFEKFGTITNLEIRRRQSDGKCAGFGHLVCSEEDTYQAILKAKKVSFKGRTMVVAPFMDKEALTGRRESLSKRKVLISNVSTGTTDAQFRRYFSKFGEIEIAYVVKSGRKNQKIEHHYGFVVYKSYKDAQRVAKNQGLRLNGSCLKARLHMLSKNGSFKDSRVLSKKSPVKDQRVVPKINPSSKPQEKAEERPKTPTNRLSIVSATSSPESTKSTKRQFKQVEETPESLPAAIEEAETPESVTPVNNSHSGEASQNQSKKVRSNSSSSGGANSALACTRQYGRISDFLKTSICQVQGRHDDHKNLRINKPEPQAEPRDATFSKFQAARNRRFQCPTNSNYHAFYLKDDFLGYLGWFSFFNNNQAR